MCNLSMLEAEAGGSQLCDLPGLHSETLSLRTENDQKFNGRPLAYMQEALVQSPELSVDTTLAWKFSPDFFSLLPCGLGTSQSTLTFV